MFTYPWGWVTTNHSKKGHRWKTRTKTSSVIWRMFTYPFFGGLCPSMLRKLKYHGDMAINTKSPSNCPNGHPAQTTVLVTAESSRTPIVKFPFDLQVSLKSSYWLREAVNGGWNHIPIQVVPKAAFIRSYNETKKIKFGYIWWIMQDVLTVVVHEMRNALLFVYCICVE